MEGYDDIADIKERIDSTIEALDDVTFSLLREAARQSGNRPSADKTLVQARRALEKASRLLASLEAED